MSVIVISLLLLAALAVAAWLMWRPRAATPVRAKPPAAATPPVALRRQALPQAGTAPSASPVLAQAPAQVQPHAPAADAIAAQPPAALAAFDWKQPDALTAEQRQLLVHSLRRIPRPPAALHQLLSPQFLDRAGSNELSELITGEAQIAAKVLASVNSPAYGLHRPVSGIGQAVTFLGLNTVRGICLRYLLDDAFKPSSPALQQAYGEIWNASALASELCNRLATKLGLAETSALVAQVLLSFIGHLAAASLLADKALPAGARLAGGALLQRTGGAQDQLGLGPSEIGGLLLQEWGLPAAIVDEVRAIDRLLVTPAGTLPVLTSQRLAVAHLCARLGEQLALAGATQPPNLAALADAQAQADDGFHLRSHLAAPALARLPDHLQTADLVQAVVALRQGMATRR